MTLKTHSSLPSKTISPKTQLQISKTPTPISNGRASRWNVTTHLGKRRSTRKCFHLGSPPTTTASVQIPIQRRVGKLVFWNPLKILAKNCTGDINSAFATTLVSIPTSLTLVLSVNSQLPENEKIHISIVIFSIVSGYIMSFLINGGNPL